MLLTIQSIPVIRALNSQNFESKFTTESLVFTLKIVVHATEKNSRFEVFLGWDLRALRYNQVAYNKVKSRSQGLRYHGSSLVGTNIEQFNDSSISQLWSENMLKHRSSYWSYSLAWNYEIRNFLHIELSFVITSSSLHLNLVENGNEKRKDNYVKFNYII